MDWYKKVEKIAQVTQLPIRGIECSIAEVEPLRLEQERSGWELFYVAHSADRAFLYVIQPDRWDPSARALLRLYLSPVPTSLPSVPMTEQLAAWFHSLLEQPLTPPPRSIQELTWREGRVCFLLERCRHARVSTWQTVQPLLNDFFPSSQPASLFVPLSPSQLLLIVPLSVLGAASLRDESLEWAYGLQDLLTNELLEEFRVLVSPQVDSLPKAGAAFIHLHRLSLALERYRPRERVAASWQYPLERWAAVLPDVVTAGLSQGMSTVLALPALNQEQKETLETLFAHQLNVSETARQLYIHRNTLLYRLDKITEATGLDPRHFPDAVLLQLHLLLGPTS